MTGVGALNPVRQPPSAESLSAASRDVALRDLDKRVLQIEVACVGSFGTHSYNHLCRNSTQRYCARARKSKMGDLQPIVIDNGSGTIRAGYAGEDLPKCFFPSFVGRPKHLRVLAGGLEGDTFIGNKAQELRGLLKIRYPLEHGIVTDWEDMERIWQYIYTEELKTLSEEVCHT